VRPEKKCDINKLTRKQLIVKCKGRGIRIGKLEAETERLQAKMDVAPHVAELYDSYMASLGEIEKLEQAFTTLEEKYVESVQAEVDADALTSQAERRSSNLEADNVGLRKMIVDMKIELSDAKKATNIARQDSKKHDEHWRELAQFTALNTGQLINALKTMHTASAYINDKYKEE